MANLDDPNLYRTLDRAGMGQHIASLPAQCRNAWVRALAFPLPESYRQVERVLVLGMGGSAIAGDLLADLQACQGGIPVEVHRDYGLARPIDARTLLIASSYSGNTEETLTAFERAWKPGTKALAMTTGGTLGRQCAMKGVPVFPLEPAGQPRNAVGQGFFAPLGFLQRLGLAEDRTAQVTEAVRALEALAHRIGPETPAARNPVKRLAALAAPRMVVIFGAQHLTSVARRWKNQLSENAKAWAFFEALPEADHNTVEGVQFPRAAPERLLAVFLRSRLYHPRVALRCELTAEILRKAGCLCESVDAEGEGPLAEMMTTVLMGDYLSYYLAMENGVDPSTMPNIDGLKRRMAGG